MSEIIIRVAPIAKMMGLVGGATTIYAMATVPIFVGTAGVAMSLLIGAGTFIAGTACTLVGAFVGQHIIDKAIRWSEKGRQPTLAALMLGSAVGAVVGMGSGVWKSYTWTQDAMEQKACAVPFNDAVAQKCAQMGLTIAPKATAPAATR